MDVPRLLLAIAVRRMPGERREWGVAMLAELAQLQHLSTRWQFALSCIRVALFPPRKGSLMNEILGSLRIMSGIGLIWGVLWPLLAIILGTIIEVITGKPGSTNPEDAPDFFFMLMIGLVGFICGVVFGGLLLIAERGKTILDFSLIHAAIWGILVGVAFPIVMGKDIGNMIVTVPFGVVSATASVALMRKWAPRLDQ